MRKKIITSSLLLFFIITAAWGQKFTVEAVSNETADALDIEAVADLFAETESLEAFELALNDTDKGINNLDLDDDGYVDYLVVNEEVNDNTHLVVIQALLGENEIQDVAVIEIEQTGENEYNMYVQGDETLYGPDFYYIPATTHIYTWPIVIRLYRPAYKPYRTVYYYGHYHPTWHARKPVPAKAYHMKTAKIKRHVFVRHNAKVIHTNKIKREVKRSERVKTRKTVRAEKPVKTRTKSTPKSHSTPQKQRDTNRR